MVAANGEQVAVAGVDHNVEIGIRQLESGGEGKRATVSGVEGIEVHVAGDASGAADAGDNRQVLDVDVGIHQGAREGIHAGADAAAGAPDVRDAIVAQERIGYVGMNGKGRHRATSMMACRICSGL